MSISEKQFKAFRAAAYRLKLIRQGKQPEPPDETTLEFAESLVKNADGYRQATIAAGNKASYADSDISLCQWALTKFKGGNAATTTPQQPVEATWSMDEFPAIRAAIGDTPVSATLALYGLVVAKPGGGYRDTEKYKAYLGWVRGQIAEERTAGVYVPVRPTVNEQKALRNVVDAER